MKISIFASVIIFTVWLTFQLHHQNEVSQKKENSFWEKERRANSTRRKPLDSLPYIAIPLETLPTDALPENERAAEFVDRLRVLSREKIVNFTGISNTDLKLAYGAPNINLLSSYDQNYTLLARTLQEWGSLLYENGLKKETLSVLEFALSTGTDVSGTYRLLKTLYQELDTPEKIDQLLEQAETLQSASKNSIIRLLKES